LVSVTFRPGEEVGSACLSVKGRVAHQSLHGFGVEFDGLDAQCRAALDRLLPQMPPVPMRPLPVLRAI
jgi:hypothetical protein